MATRKDYYSALGVDKSAPQEEIKRAYRKLARKLHPDVNPGDAGAEERFKAVSEAYHVLGDPERRRKYDSVGPEAFAQQFDPSDFATQFGQFLGGGLGGFRVGGIRGSGAAGARGGVGNLDDLLEGLLGGAGGRGAGPFGDAPPRPAASGPSPGPRTPQGKDGRNVTVRLQLTLEDAVAGVEKTITYRQPAMCTSCGGAGCSHCKGSGEELHRQTTRVRVPAGVRDGSRVRVKGKGNPASGGRPAGDLNVEIAVQPHPRFEVRGNDLRTTLPVTVYEAVLGGPVTVPTLNGTTRINLPEGTRNEQLLRVRGQGLVKRPVKRSGSNPSNSAVRGDLVVRVAVEMPPIDSEVKRLMRELQERRPYEPRSRPEADSK